LDQHVIVYLGILKTLTLIFVMLVIIHVLLVLIKKQILVKLVLQIESYQLKQHVIVLQDILIPVNLNVNHVPFRIVLYVIQVHQTPVQLVIQVISGVAQLILVVLAARMVHLNRVICVKLVILHVKAVPQDQTQIA
jgi:hypothetical protein